MNKSIKSILVVSKHISSERLLYFLQIFNRESNTEYELLLQKVIKFTSWAGIANYAKGRNPRGSNFGGKRTISLFQKVRPWGPPSLLFNGYRGSLARVKQLGVNVTTHLHPVPRLRMSGAVQDADKSLARPTSRCIWFDCENISFDTSLVIFTNSNNIPPIMIINRKYETQNLLSL